jgi:hypothetical protein
MQYMLLIYGSEAGMKNAAAGDQAAMMKEYGDFTQSIVKSGNMRAGDALQPTSSATTVRVRDGKTLSTDGPFAETKEQLGGYYLVEAKDLDEATKIAARIPGARTGSIEVRPVIVFPTPA